MDASILRWREFVAAAMVRHCGLAQALWSGGTAVKLPLTMNRLVVVVLAGIAWAALFLRLVCVPSPGDVPARASPSDRVISASGESDSEMVFGVYRDAKRIGWTRTDLRPEGDGFRLEQATRIRIAVLGETMGVESTLRAKLASDLSVERLEATLVGSGTRMKATAEVEGGVVAFTVDGGSGARQGTLPVPEAVYVQTGARAHVARHLEPGRRFEFAILDPVTWSLDDLTVEVVGRAEAGEGDGDIGWRIEEGYRGVSSTVWLDESGRPTCERGPMGLEMRREIAHDAAGLALEVLDVENATAIPIAEIADARERKSLKLKFRGIHPETIPSGPGQWVEADILQLQRVEPARVGDAEVGTFDPEWAEFVEEEPGVQVRHARIQALAREVVGDERSVFVASRALIDWVYDYLEKVPSIGVPDALTVLDSGRGDCNEHATLFTALARAAGIPTRIAAGLVYVDGRFVYHAWTEVRGRRDWLPVDPALRQFPADATHIALVYGGLSQQASLASIVGELHLEPID